MEATTARARDAEFGFLVRVREPPAQAPEFIVPTAPVGIDAGRGSSAPAAWESERSPRRSQSEPAPSVCALCQPTLPPGPGLLPTARAPSRPEVPATAERSVAGAAAPDETPEASPKDARRSDRAAGRRSSERSAGGGRCAPAASSPHVFRNTITLADRAGTVMLKVVGPFRFRNVMAGSPDATTSLRLYCPVGSP